MSVAIKTILFTALLAMGAVTVGVPYLILRGGNRFAIEIGGFRWLGLPLIAAGAIIYLRAGAEVGAERKTGGLIGRHNQS
jgi:hypothetical protein